MDLSKVSTDRLLRMLKVTRRKLVQPWSFYHEDDPDAIPMWEEDKKFADDLRKELATREHIVKGSEGRKLRQKAKQHK